MVVSSWVKRSIIGLGGCIGLGVGRSQIVLPGSQYVQNLTQTVKDSWILDTNGQPLIRLHDTSADSSNRISIPPGALRDQSVVADDIDRSTAPAGETYDCGSGILRGVESDGRVSCGSYAVGGSLWESTDEGQASIYYGTTTQSDIVSVGSHPSLIPLSANFSEGVYASGDIQTQTSLVRGDGVMELTAPGTYLVSAPRGGVLAWLGVAQAADPVDAAVLAHRVPLAIGQVFLNPAYSTPASVGVAKTDPQQ
ncbi:MAG: hypothetical protein H6766_01175 [Candidatus Peribacteria bacterium]|nr:MAG: hypothetical protein H6766_01175 [Candidatus Peribacteria bacterium]